MPLVLTTDKGCSTLLESKQCSVLRRRWVLRGTDRRRHVAVLEEVRGVFPRGHPSGRTSRPRRTPVAGRQEPSPEPGAQPSWNRMRPLSQHTQVGRCSAKLPPCTERHRCDSGVETLPDLHSAPPGHAQSSGLENPVAAAEAGSGDVGPGSHGDRQASPSRRRRRARRRHPAVRIARRRPPAAERAPARHYAGAMRRHPSRALRYAAVPALPVLLLAATACAPTEDSPSGSEGSSGLRRVARRESAGGRGLRGGGPAAEAGRDADHRHRLARPSGRGSSTTTRPTARASSPRWPTPSPRSSASPRATSSG